MSINKIGTDITLIHWRDRLYNDILDLRSLERLINSKSFELAWDSATDEEKGTVLQLIEKKDSRASRKWMKDHNQANLSLRELREIASQLSIIGYSRLPKEQLLVLIYQKEEANGNRESGDRDSSSCGSHAISAREVLPIQTGINNL